MTQMRHMSKTKYIITPRSWFTSYLYTTPSRYVFYHTCTVTNLLSINTPSHSNFYLAYTTINRLLKNRTIKRSYFIIPHFILTYFILSETNTTSHQMQQQNLQTAPISPSPLFSTPTSTPTSSSSSSSLLSP